MSNRLLSQLAHVEFYSPKPQETLAFLRRSSASTRPPARSSRSTSGLGRVVPPQPRADRGPASRPGSHRLAHARRGRAALAAERLEGRGPGGLARGLDRPRAGVSLRGPGGHLSEVFWEVERWHAPPHLASTYPNRPQKLVPRGATFRQLDHTTHGTPNDPFKDALWYRDTLGFRFMEWREVGGAPSRRSSRTTRRRMSSASPATGRDSGPDAPRRLLAGRPG